ncbi:MAG: mechanosensitive ion channel family protein [Tannerellaceae bacterium]|jgi:MscS family membrane protein|nr:mechanosensitive ion channel family protein [Tannerellaceae bacterium]
MLEKEFLGNTLQNWGISILFIVGAFVIVKIVSWIGKKHIEPFIKRTNNKLDDIIYSSVKPPLLFAIMLIGFWIAIHRLSCPDTFVKAVDSASKILIILNITWLFAKLISRLLEQYWVGNADDVQQHKMYPIVNRAFLVIIWIIGLVMALSNVGVNIAALLGTLGIGGIAFALAAQDTVKNIFGAFTILTDKPFNIGDTVRIDSFEGTIVDVGIRSTKIMDYDKRVITMPNYKITDASIINISSEDPYRRVVMKIGLTYDTTPEKMQEAMDLLKSMPSRVACLKEDDITVFFSDFGDFSMVITFIYFIEKSAGIQPVTSNVNMEILMSFNKAGLSFAFPSQTLYIDYQSIK